MKLSLLALLLSLSLAQIGNNPPIPPSWNQRPGQSPTPNSPNREAPEDPADRMRRQNMEKLNNERLAQAKTEAARLLELATELKQQVDGTGAGTVSAKTGTDADEIVKLAKSIKTKTRPL